jgi:hypothetical protein
MWHRALQYLLEMVRVSLLQLFGGLAFSRLRNRDGAYDSAPWIHSPVRHFDYGKVRTPHSDCSVPGCSRVKLCNSSTRVASAKNPRGRFTSQRL